MDGSTVRWPRHPIFLNQTKHAKVCNFKILKERIFQGFFFLYLGMPWYQYVAAFFSGMFLANAVPHFIHGISGDRFPTPFARPPGKGLSSPFINTLWALANTAAGAFLFYLGNIDFADKPLFVAFFAGIALISLQLSRIFEHKEKE